MSVSAYERGYGPGYCIPYLYPPARRAFLQIFQLIPVAGRQRFQPRLPLFPGGLPTTKSMFIVPPHIRDSPPDTRRAVGTIASVRRMLIDPAALVGGLD
jgi:hypothetical protein